MEIIIEIPQDINKLCRTCMTVIREDEAENEISCEGDQSNYLCTMLKYVTSLNVTTTDGLPTVMCNACVKKLQIAYAFKEQCENTYMNFQEIISSDICSPAESRTASVKKLSCAFCSHKSPTPYELSKHLIRHYRNQSLLSRYSFNRGERNCSETCADVDEDRELLIEERKCEDVKQINGVNVKDDDSEEVIVEFLGPQSDNETVVVKQEGTRMCDLCDRIFSSDLRLSLHFVNHALLVESDTDPNIFDQYVFCSNCGQTFDNKNELIVHTNSCPIDHEQTHECLKCSLMFDSELSLLKHEKYVDHNGDYFWDEFLTKSTVKDNYSCPICAENFARIHDLSLHSVKHVVKKILCRICKALFSTQIACNEHLRTHPKYRHVCNLCGKFLGSKHALKMHIMGVHSATKNFICGICSKGFKTPGRLHIHKLTHRKEKKFVCSYCAYRTNNVGDFKVHNRIHTSERPYKCHFVNCAKRFKTSSHLNEHIQRHLQIKKFHCSMCDMVFGHSHTLKMHLLVHTGEKPFSCEHCKARFRRKHHLKNHMKQHAQ